MTQRMQVVVQNNIVNAALKPGNQPLKAPFVMRLVTAVPWLQGITARFWALACGPSMCSRGPSVTDDRGAKSPSVSRTQQKKPRTMPGL